MSVLKPKIMRFRLSPVLSTSYRNRFRRIKLLLKRVLSLTHLSAKISLERLLLCLAQIIYTSSSYAGQLFRSLPAAPDASRHRHGPCERDGGPFLADWPA